MTIKEKARKEYPSVNPYDYPETYNYNKSAEKGFIKGAEWMLNKAVKWLKGNVQNYYEDGAMHDDYWYDDDEQMIEDFVKAMEEE